jgi:hypothetical protein
LSIAIALPVAIAAGFLATAKIEQLKKELTAHFKEPSTYNKAKTMGDVVKRHLKQTLQKNLLLVPKSKH